MANLTRRDPFLELSETMDRLFEGGFSRPWRLLQNSRDETVSMPIEVSEAEDEICVKASLPGVNPEDIDISVQGDMVQIRAESREEAEDKQQNYIRRELNYGVVQRSISLPSRVDTNRTEATFQNGVLRLRLGKSEEAKPKRIQVQGSEAPRQIRETDSPD